jgi:cardiolipin synthase
MKTYFEAEHIRLVFSGRDYFEALEQLIDNSTHTLHLQTYIFNSDQTGLRIIERLIQAARRGVRVFMIVDAFGSLSLKKEVVDTLHREGVHFRFYSPLFSSGHFFSLRRLHHKVVVADQRSALIGGINIADKYHADQEGKAWLDYAVLIRGRICEYPALLCHAIFHQKRRPRLVAWENKFRPGPEGQPGRLIRFRRNDFIKQQNEIHHSYTESIREAKQSITIVASYFLPGNHLRRLLRQAAARGVRIRIILAGVSDVASVQLAQSYLYEFYLKHHVELYEWQNSVLHGKAMLVDGSWATIGSYNLNFLSHYISIELNADIRDPSLLEEFSRHLDQILAESCRAVDLAATQNKRPWFRKMIMKLAYIFHRSLMNLVMARRKPVKKRH